MILKFVSPNLDLGKKNIANSMSEVTNFAKCVTCLPPFAYEPRCEKTGLRGFRPCPTQTGLYSHRRCLEA